MVEAFDVKLLSAADCTLLPYDFKNAQASSGNVIVMCLDDN